MCSRRSRKRSGSRSAKDADAELRRRAERQLDMFEREPTAPGEDPRRLLHELEVHQIELQMQNEALRTAQAEAEASLARYTELFDFAPIGYCALDSRGAIRQANLALARLLGIERQGLIGRRFVSSVPMGRRAEFASCLERMLNSGGDGAASMSCETALVDGQGEPRDVMLTGSLLAGAPPLVLLAVEDVTRRKRAEAALAAESRNKDLFLATLSHELRNPLASIRYSLFVLDRAAAGGEQARKAQAIIERQVGHLTHIVDDLLDVTRISRGLVRLQMKRLELGELVRRVMDEHRPAFAAGGIGFSARFGSELFWIDGDATRLTQVVDNLLGNAAKFTSRGGVVEVSLRSEDRSATLSVRDNGVGIAADLLKVLFEPFTQGPELP